MTTSAYTQQIYQPIRVSYPGGSVVDASGNVLFSVPYPGQSLPSNWSFGALTPATWPTSGINNVAMGPGSLKNLSVGTGSTAIGWAAGNGCTATDYSTMVGSYAGQMGGGTHNSYYGANTGQFQTGSFNTAYGTNVFRGVQGLSSGNYNAYFGWWAGATNTTGASNTGIGISSLQNNTQGIRNTCVGAGSGLTIATGSNNTLLGNSADVTNSGYNNSIAIGYNAKVTGNNQLVIGSSGTPINTATSAARTGGTATALPAQPVIWMQLILNGTTYYLPLYQ